MATQQRVACMEECSLWDKSSIPSIFCLFSQLMVVRLLLGSGIPACTESSINTLRDGVRGAGQVVLCASANCMMQLACARLPAGCARIGVRKCMQA